MTNEERELFYRCVIRSTSKLMKMLTAFEWRVAQHIKLPDDISPGTCVAASLLMVLCGMLADDEEGFPELLDAAELLGGRQHPMREEIRQNMDKVLDEMDIVFTRYLYN